MTIMHQGWADDAIAKLYHAAERISQTLENGSTEQGLISEAMSKIELADTYVEQRQRDALADSSQ
jgi:hypothetical protein